MLYILMVENQKWIENPPESGLPPKSNHLLSHLDPSKNVIRIR